MNLSFFIIQDYKIVAEAKEFSKFGLQILGKLHVFKV